MWTEGIFFFKVKASSFLRLRVSFRIILNIFLNTIFPHIFLFFKRKVLFKNSISCRAVFLKSCKYQRGIPAINIIVIFFAKGIKFL